MQYHWLNKQDNDKLILFFCGWSFDYKPFEKLNCNDYDVLIVYDYSDIASNNAKDFLSKKFFIKYKKIDLITWSMGVYVAYLMKNILPKFDKKIAINGTPYPVDDSFGIPSKTFDLTLKFVDTGLQGKFQKNLFKKNEDYEKYLKTPVERSIENQKQELVALNDFIKNQKCDYDEFYDRAIISDTDKIIPTRNQVNFWTGKAEIKILDSGHFPFFEFESWKDILLCK